MATSLARVRSNQLADFNKLFSPLFEQGVGFDRIFDSMTRALHETERGGSYPPYDIVETDENTYDITLAVAGFADQDISIRFENGTLTVSGEKTNGEASDAVKYLHRGIANRKFLRRFNLAEHIRVGDATLRDGMLTIHLVRELPEALKPRTIEISTS